MQREFKKCSALLKGSSGGRENIVARRPSIHAMQRIMPQPKNRRKAAGQAVAPLRTSVEATPELRNEANSVLCFQQKPETEANFAAKPTCGRRTAKAQPQAALISPDVSKCYKEIENGLVARAIAMAHKESIQTPAAQMA
jgi:hypothetical protein